MKRIVQLASLQCALSRICDNNIAIILGINFRTWFAKSHVTCKKRLTKGCVYVTLVDVEYKKSQTHAYHHTVTVAWLCLTQSRKSFFQRTTCCIAFFALFEYFYLPAANKTWPQMLLQAATRLGRNFAISSARFSLHFFPKCFTFSTFSSLPC